MLLRFEKFFPNQIKEIIENSSNKSYRFKHYFDVFILFILNIRLTVCLGCLYLNTNIYYWNYDPFCNFILKIGGELNHLYLMLGLMLTLLGIDGKFSFFLVNDLFPFKMVYSLVVENHQQIQFCIQPKCKRKLIFKTIFNTILNKHLKRFFCRYLVPYFLLKIYCYLLTELKIIVNLDYVDQRKIKKLNLHRLIHQLSWNLRKKLCFTGWIIDQIINVVHFFLCKFFWMIFFLHEIINH